MTGPQVTTIPGGGVVLRLRTGQRRPTITPRDERERILLALHAIRRDAQGASRKGIAGFRGDMARALSEALPQGTGTLTPARGRRIMRAVERFLRLVERILLGHVQESTGSVLRSQRGNLPGLPRDFDRRARAAAREGLRPLRRSAELVTAPTRAEIAAYIRSVTGKEPTEVAIRATERILAGDIPVDISGVTNAAGTVKRAERVIVSETLNTMREGDNVALKTYGGLLARWVNSRDSNVCAICHEIARLDLGFGPGWLPPELWPKTPHPYCRCYQGGLDSMTPAQEDLARQLIAEGVTVYGVLGIETRDGIPVNPLKGFRERKRDPTLAAFRLERLERAERSGGGV